MIMVHVEISSCGELHAEIPLGNIVPSYQSEGTPCDQSDCPPPDLEESASHQDAIHCRDSAAASKLLRSAGSRALHVLDITVKRSTGPST